MIKYYPKKKDGTDFRFGRHRCIIDLKDINPSKKACKNFKI